MPSKTRIDRAGAALRAWWLRESTEEHRKDNNDDLDLLSPDLDVVWEYRAQFQYPLTRVSANLRYYVAEESSEVIIAQRLNLQLNP